MSQRRWTIGHLRQRLEAELHGRSPLAAAGDLYHLVRSTGPVGLLQRLGYEVNKRAVDHRAPVSPLVATHAWGSAHAPIFDLSPDELDANAAVVARFDERTTDVRTATWFLAYFDHALFGGIHTILRLMDWMRDVHGVEHRLVVFDRHEATDEQVRSAITAAFPGLEAVDIVLPVHGEIPYDELPTTDIAISTLWVSAYPLARFNRTGAKFSMVADYEPDFYAAGTVRALAEATYRFGFAGIVNTPGLGEIYEEFGHPSMSFMPAVRSSSAPQAKPSDSGGPIQIVLYGRPSTERNAFELLAAAARRIKERFSDGVRIVSAGEEWEPSEFMLEGVVENLGLLSSLEQVDDLYRASDIGLCFMFSKHPSYQPFEYLAAGAVPVCNINPATTWLLRHGENCLLTEPFPSHVLAAVERLVLDADLRARLAKQGHADVTVASWNDEFERIWSFVSNAPAPER